CAHLPILGLPMGLAKMRNSRNFQATMTEDHAMKIFSANIESLQGLYIRDLKKALGMEQMISRVLPLVVESCSDQGLAAAFRKHLQETKGHVSKVEGLLRRLIGEAS